MSRHRAGTPKARRFKVVGAVMAVVVGFVALGAAAIIGKPDVVAEIAVDRLTEIERLAPLDTHELVLTPGLGQDNQWWNTLIAFMPAKVRLDNLKPTADLGITHLGYSISAADPKSGLSPKYLRMLYVSTDSAAHAKDVQRWLSVSKGGTEDTFSTAVRGHTVVLAVANFRVTSALAEEGHGLGSSVAYRQDTAKRDAGSLIWQDWGAYVKAAGASGGKPAEYSKFFHGITGFIKGSRWVGYSTSPQVGWSGKFQSGGMDPKLVSATNVASAIQSYDKVLARNFEGIPTATDSGAGSYLRGAFHVKHPSLSGPQAKMGSEQLAFKPKSGGDTAFSYDPTPWFAGTTRSGVASAERISLFAYSINGSQINLKVTVKKADYPGSAPVQTLPPPSQRHAGYTPQPVRNADKDGKPISPDH